MPAARVELEERAITEALEATDWYDARSAGAGDAFLRELDSSIALIAAAPESWPQHGPGTRRFLLRRFPFAVVYRVAAGGVLVVAIAHTSRRPGCWHDR